MENNFYENLQYPIGKFQAPATITDSQIKKWINQLEEFPMRLRATVMGLTDEQLNTRYRSEGWTLRQVVHHLADSHINSYVRFKLAMTEDTPTIRPYMEDRWAECLEARTAPVEVSLDLLESIHLRWVMFLRTLSPEDFDRAFIHPEHNKKTILKNVLGMYVWHGEHHLAHILSTKKRNGW